MKQPRFVELDTEKCPEHVRCEKCKPNRWPNLAHGCCACRRRILNNAGPTTAKVRRK